MTATLWPLTQQVDLIDNEDGNFLDITSVLPAPAHAVPLLWRGHNKVSLRYGFHVWSHVARQFYHTAWGQNGRESCWLR